MITTIIFDLGGVLFTNGARAFITYVCDTYQLDRELVHEVIDGELGSAYREAKISKDVYWKQAISLLGINATGDALSHEWINRYELIVGTKDLIVELKKQYNIYYLSDNVRERVEALDRKYHFLRLFDGGIFSHDVGMRKPNPQIYKKILALADVSGSEAVYIDDKIYFLEPAKALGMHVIHFKNAEKLKNDLLTLLTSS
ncbi:MAG: HAD family phosphatase [Patescibacteria group bacterium]